MRKYSIPCIISLLVAALYNIVDQIFIANASYLGSYGNAANTILIYGAKWGMMGAAVATIAGQILTAVMAVWYLPRMKSVKLDKGSFSPDAGLISKFVPLGITSLLSQISVVASMAAVNNMVRKYGALDPIFGQEQYAQIPMAVVGIVMKFFQIVISVAVGLAAGCIPVVGYNIGAGRKDRAKGLFTLLLKCEAATGLVALLIVELLPRQLIGLFGAGNESAYYAEFGIRCFRIYLCMIVLALMNKGSFIFLQSLGKATESSVLSLIREILFGVGLTILLPALFALNGVLYSMPVSDALTFLMSAFVIRRTYQELRVDPQ